MKKFYNQYCASNTWFHILTGFSIILLIASWLAPPTGVIDSSVLAAIGEIFAFAALGTVIKAIDKGVDAKMTKGDTSIEIINDDKDNE